jgi:serine/threonine protein kinase
VYRAEHLIWKQPVAIKCFRVLSSAPEHQRQELLDGFIQEGKLMTSLSSRTAAIVQARDVGTFTAPNGDWVPYMVLEWLEGRPLDHALWVERSQNLPLRSLQETLSLLESAAQALDVVHGMNIAHRDIKPANFFVIGDARAEGTLVKILDFGIAKVMAEHAHMATSLAQTGSTVTAFTPNYGAPEQFSRMHGATGPWTDVFAMALTILEILRGQPALEGDDYLQLAIAARDESRRPSPRTLGLQVSDAVEAVFLRALAVSPKDRYRSMGEFWTDLYAAPRPRASPTSRPRGRAICWWSRWSATRPSSPPAGGSSCAGGRHRRRSRRHPRTR